MKAFWDDRYNTKWDIFICVFLLILSVGMVWSCGKYKVIDFCDEAFTYETANSIYKELPLRTSEEWISGQDISNYFAATDTWFNHSGIEKYLWQDHLPLYFYIFRFISMYLFHGSSTPWIGLSLNLIVWIALTILLYFLGREILKNPFLSGAFVFLSTFCTQVMVSQLFLIRMYLLMSFLCLGCLLYASKILVARTISWKDFGLLFLFAVIGFTTHYYFWVFMLSLSIMCGIQILIERKWKVFGLSFITVSGAFGVMTVIYSRWRSGFLTSNIQVGGQETTNISKSIVSSFLDGLKICIDNMKLINMRWDVYLALFLLIILFSLYLSWRRDIFFFKLLLTGSLTASLYATVICFIGKNAWNRYFYPGIVLLNALQFLALLYDIKCLLCFLEEKKVKPAKIFYACMAIVCIALMSGRGYYVQKSNVSSMKNAYKKIECLESVSEIPWLYVGDDGIWEFYEIVFDLKIPKKIGNYSLLSDEVRNEVLDSEKEAIIYCLNLDIENIIEEINATSENIFIYEKIAEGHNSEIYHLYVN